MADDGEDPSSSYHIPVSLPTIPSATGAGGIIYDSTQQHDASTTGIPDHPPATENETSTTDTAAAAAAAGTNCTMRYYSYCNAVTMD